MATVLNGRLPASMLAVIPWDGRERVRNYALPSLVRLNATFRAAFGHDLIVNEGYRDLATQERYYAKPPSGAGTAAKPGTSNHGWGLAVDLKLRGGEYAWMLANAPRYGWINPLWARDGKGIEEPWHWEHVGAPAVTPDPIRPAPTPPADPLGEDDTMHERAIIAAYRKHLGRTPSAAEVDDRILRIATGGATLAQEIASVAGSPEAKRWPVVRLYRTLLGRTPSASEADKWLADTGGDLAAIEAGIRRSGEYQSKR